MLRTFVYLLILSIPLNATTYYVISQHTEPYSNIAILEDIQGNRCVIKQILEADGNEQFSLIMDCLSAEIAQKKGIPCNTVTLIPAQVNHVGKSYVELPATLHSFAPGYQLSEQNGPYSTLDIQQRCRPLGSHTWHKYGMLKPQYMSFRTKAFKHLALHPHLAQLAALDTFVGNNDRACNNLFYDPITNSFCGIDMANSYKQNLCKIALTKFLLLKSENYQWSESEIKALEIYYTTLHRLVNEYNPLLLHWMLDRLVAQSGIHEIHFEYYTFEQRLAFYKDMISESYIDALALMTLLEVLFPQFNNCYTNSTESTN